MKKIVALILVLTFAAFAFASCAPAEKTYSLAVAVNTVVSESNQVTNKIVALVLDADGKIVSARFECAQVTPALDDNGALVAQESVATKVEKGDAYVGMEAGSWKDQAAAYEKFIVGKTAAEIAALDPTDKTLIAGCTMTGTMTTFQGMIAKAFASTNKVTFTTAEAITSGVAINTSVLESRGAISVNSDLAAVVFAGDKVAATIIDVIEQTFAIEEGEIVANALKASKLEQGEAYVGMPAGPWYKQAPVYAATTLGKTVAELENLETVSDALAAAGCTMQGTAPYKAAIIKAAKNAR